MHRHVSCGVAVCLLMAITGFAGEKKKHILPAYLRTARTAAIIIDPDAGKSVTDPQANEIAQNDVENALRKWGRLLPTIDMQNADLIIVVRRGNRHLATETVPDGRQDTRVGVNPTKDGTTIWAEHVPRPNPTGNASGPAPGPAHPQIEIGANEDSFIVYRGGVDNPLEAAPAWSYVAKDALHSHDVPAVAAFRKALADADKAAAAKGP